MAHDHNHSHAPPNYTKAFAIGIGLNVAYIVAELIAGLSVRSLALLADAGHNISDVLCLLLAWGASFLSQTAPTKRHSYGLRGSSILASLANAIILLIAIGAIGWEAVRRFGEPVIVPGTPVMLVAAVGVVLNGATALLFLKGRERDLNIKGAFLHMAADAGVSAGVILAGLAINLTGAQWIDPATSLLIVVVIAISTWGLLRDSVNLSLGAVPREINPTEVENYLLGLPGVTKVHDLHIWAMSTTETALTAHLVKPDAEIDDALLARVCDELHDKFEIGHSTIQLEHGSSAHPCKQAPDHMV
jgi:cation diffusion facilitator family transporter